MSKESSEWLNQNTLIGFSEKRGTAWHYRASDQGDEPNHYPGAVRVADVQRRLFSWSAEERPLYIPDGENSPMIAIPDRKAIVRSDTNHVMGIFKDGYEPHDYNEWLIRKVSNLLDDNLSVGSAGLLKTGAVAWVSVEVPETITTNEGVAFRPNLLAATSFDGSLATTYKPVITNVVCDNTMNVALSEQGRSFKAKHTRNSSKSAKAFNVVNAREALGIVHQMAEEFEAEVQRLCHMKMTDHQFEALIDTVAPMPAPGDAKTSRAATLAEGKRDTLWRLWVNDDRVNPWSGSAYGAWQALNTYQHHEMNVRGMERAERNMINALNGKTDQADADAMQKILTLVD